VTPRSLQIHPAALEEAEAATDWYAERSRRAAVGFLKELGRSIRQVSERPEQFPEFEFGTRRIMLRTYLLVFRETELAVEIIAIAHGRRQPGYWRDRIR
jgi:plasmid stabilization system protein ParE